jgi:hypothetical protein
MQYEPIPMPVMHRSLLTDPRSTTSRSSYIDDYLISNLSITAAGSISIHTHSHTHIHNIIYI